MIAIFKAVLAAISIGSLIAKYGPWIRGFFVLSGNPLAGLFGGFSGFLKRVWAAFLVIIDNPFTCLVLVMIGVGIGFWQGDAWRKRQVDKIYAEFIDTNKRLAAFEAKDEAAAKAAKAAREASGKAVRVEVAKFKCVVPNGLGAVISRAGR